MSSMVDVAYRTPDHDRVREEVMESIRRRVIETGVDEHAMGLPLREAHEPAYPGHPAEPLLMSPDYERAVSTALSSVRDRCESAGIDEPELRRRYSPMRRYRFAELMGRRADNRFSLMTAFLIVHALGGRIDVNVTWPKRAP